MKLRDANLQVNKKNSFTHPHSCILPSFSKNTSRLPLPKILGKCATTVSFRKYMRFTCNLPVSLRFLQVNFLHDEYAIGHSLEYNFYQVNWNSFVSCNIKITKTILLFLLCALCSVF